MHKVGLIADVEKAFLMISIAEKDRDVLRFLWVSDIEEVHHPYKRYVLLELFLVSLAALFYLMPLSSII